jgi:cation/acetate symporter
MVLIGGFYVLVSFMGLGAAALVGQDQIGARLYAGQAIAYIAHHPETAAQLNGALLAHGYIVPKVDSNLAVPVLAAHLGGSLLAAFVSAVAFATILAVVAGLAIAASSAFSHDIWFNLVRKGTGDENEHLWVARATALVVGVLAVIFSVWLRGYNVGFLVGLIFAVAASANLPVILLSLSWKRFSGAGAICGMVGGLTASVLLIAISPVGMGTHALFPIENPGIVSIPFGFLAALIGSVLVPDRNAEATFEQLQVRATTGLGAEV